MIEFWEVVLIITLYRIIEIIATTLLQRGRGHLQQRIDALEKAVEDLWLIATGKMRR